MPPEAPRRAAPAYALFGLFGSPNLGNEVTLAAFLAALRARQPEARRLCVAPAQSRAVAMHGVDAVLPMLPMPVAPALWRVPGVLRPAAERLALALTQPHRRAAAVAAMRGVDALLVPGTGVVDDFGQRPDDMPAHLLRWVEAACAAGRPVHFVSIGVSRVDHAESRRRFVCSLDQAASVSVRDAQSVHNARALGVRAPPAVATDLAFSLPPAWLPMRMPEWPPRVIGLGLIGYRGWGVDEAEGDDIYRDYVQRSAVLARGLLARGLQLRLLVGDTRADAGVAQDLVAALGPAADGASVEAPAIGDFRDLLVALGDCDLVIAARYHNVLLALMSGRPAVSIGYADKNAAVMADMGQQDHCHDLTTFTPEVVLADVDRLRAAPSLRADLLIRAAQLRSRLDAQYDRVFGKPASGA